MVDLTLTNLNNRISDKKNEVKNYKLTSSEKDRVNQPYTSVHQSIAYETYLNELLKKYKRQDNIKYVEVEVDRPVYEETVVEHVVEKPVKEIVEIEKIVKVQDDAAINALTQQNQQLAQANQQLLQDNKTLVDKIKDNDIDEHALDGENNEVSTKQFQLKKQLKECHEEKQQLNDQIIWLTGQIANNKEKYETDVEKMREEYKNRFDELNQHTGQAIAKLNIQKNNYNRIKQEMQTTKDAHNKETAAKEQEYQQKLTTLQNEHKQTLDALKQQLNKLEQEKQGNNQRIAALEEQLTKCTSDLEECGKNNVNLREQNKKLTEQLKEQLNDSKQINQKIEDNKKAMKEKEQEYKDTITKLKIKITTLTQVVTDVTKEKDGIINDVTKLANNLKDRNVKPDTLKKKLDELQNKFTKIHDNATQTGLENSDLRTRNNILTEEINQLKKYIDEYKASIDKHKADTDESASAEQKLHTQIEQLKQILTEYESVLRQRIQQHNKELLKLLSDHKEEMKSAAFKDQQLRYKLLNTNKKRKFYKIVNDNLQNKIDVLIERNNALKSVELAVKKLMQEKNDLLKEIEQYKDKSKKLPRSIQLKKDLRECQDNLTDLKNNLNKIRRKKEKKINRRRSERTSNIDTDQFSLGEDTNAEISDALQSDISMSEINSDEYVEFSEDNSYNSGEYVFKNNPNRSSGDELDNKHGGIFDPDEPDIPSINRTDEIISTYESYPKVHKETAEQKQGPKDSDPTLPYHLNKPGNNQGRKFFGGAIRNYTTVVLVVVILLLLVLIYHLYCKKKKRDKYRYVISRPELYQFSHQCKE